MKTNLAILATLSLLLQPTFAHEGVELGPNGGRILELSENETMHAEVTVADGAFRIALLDKDMKPVAINTQTLTATSADRSNPQKLDVTAADNHFMVPMLEGDDFWIILQFRESESAKKVTARLHYDASICEACDAPEWLCKCKPDADKKAE